MLVYFVVCLTSHISGVLIGIGLGMLATKPVDSILRLTYPLIGPIEQEKHRD